MNFDPEIVVPPKNKCNGIARKCGGELKIMWRPAPRPSSGASAAAIAEVFSCLKS